MIRSSSISTEIRNYLVANPIISSFKVIQSFAIYARPYVVWRAKRKREIKKFFRKSSPESFRFVQRGLIEKRESDWERTSLSRETKSRRELIIRNERRWSMAVPLKAGNCWREGEGGGGQAA